MTCKLLHIAMLWKLRWRRACSIRTGVTEWIMEDNMLKSVVAVSVAMLLLGSSAMAQGTAARACAADIQGLCGGIEPGRGRIAACVKEHFKDLSEPCKTPLAPIAASVKACAADVKQNCANAHRRIAIVACMKSTLANLSDTCKSALAQVVARRR